MFCSSANFEAPLNNRRPGQGYPLSIVTLRTRVRGRLGGIHVKLLRPDCLENAAKNCARPPKSDVETSPSRAITKSRNVCVLVTYGKYAFSYTYDFANRSRINKRINIVFKRVVTKIQNIVDSCLSFIFFLFNRACAPSRRV